MGKMKHLAGVLNATLAQFVYTPPQEAYGAARTLVCLNLGYRLGASSAVNWGTVGAVLRGLRRVSPHGRILMVDNVCPSSGAPAIYERLGIYDALDAEMRLATTDDLVLADYRNPSPLLHEVISAPAYLDEFDCVIGVTTFEADANGIKGAVAHLYHALPCGSPVKPHEGVSTRHHDIYHTLAHTIDGMVLEYRVGQELNVAWGDDLLAVDEATCILTNTPLTDDLKALRN
jgi:hypothetical protein